MNNGKFATALHIMTLLSLEKNGPLSSGYIAGSINLNAAIVRKEIRNLKEQGLVQCKEGKGGGCRLGRPAKHIRLSEIYRAVNQGPILGKTNAHKPACPIGKKITRHIIELYATAESALLKKLGGIKLNEFNNGLL